MHPEKKKTKHARSFFLLGQPRPEPKKTPAASRTKKTPGVFYLLGQPRPKPKMLRPECFSCFLLRQPRPQKKGSASSSPFPFFARPAASRTKKATRPFFGSANRIPYKKERARSVFCSASRVPNKKKNAPGVFFFCSASRVSYKKAWRTKAYGTKKKKRSYPAKAVQFPALQAASAHDGAMAGASGVLLADPNRGDHIPKPEPAEPFARTPLLP